MANLMGFSEYWLCEIIKFLVEINQYLQFSDATNDTIVFIQGIHFRKKNVCRYFWNLTTTLSDLNLLCIYFQRRHTHIILILYSDTILQI